MTWRVDASFRLRSGVTGSAVFSVLAPDAFEAVHVGRVEARRRLERRFANLEPDEVAELSVSIHDPAVLYPALATVSLR